MPAKAPVKSLSLPDQFTTAIALVDRATAVQVITTKEEYDKAQADYRSLIQFEKELDVQYGELECVIQAKAAQVQKKELAAKFSAAKQYLKNQPMKAYDDAREAERQAEERRLQAEAKRLADIETARQVAEQKAAWEKAEAARKVAESEAKKAQAAAIAAAKRGNDEAAAAARQRAEEARVAAYNEIKRQEAARAEADAIRADAAAAPAPVVVVEKSHAGVTRRKVYRWRLTCKDGRKFTKAEMTASTRLQIKDLGALPPHLYVLSPVLLNEFVDSQGDAAAIPGVLEVASSMV